jgi:tetratricopeptide (TPR) repeat protein
MSARQVVATHDRSAKRIDAERMRGLPPAAVASLRETARLIDQGKVSAAEVSFLMAATQAPDHPETLRWSGVLQLMQGWFKRAVADFERVLDARPDDAEVLCLLARAHTELGAYVESLSALRKAAACTVDEKAWLTLGVEFDRQGYAEDALAAADRALALNRDNGVARLLRARCLQSMGQPDAAAKEYRSLIARNLHAPSAWFSLLDIKTVQIDAAELSALERSAAKAASLSADDRMMLTFALGRAYEGAELYEQAFATLARANSSAQLERPWNRAAFSTHVGAVRTAFSQINTSADISQGSEVIFVVGLPRSGSTLIEQMLAAHPRVEGASELPYLNRVISDESARRRQPFPQWVADATAADWARLGNQYLQLSARWRAERPVSTDKLPSNWLLAGAALAMLPGARIIDCRREAIETCWSCYKQLFAKGMADFAYSFEDLSAYWRDCERLGNFWAERYPTQFRIQHYEDFVADPEAETRSLLDFCGLPFDSACLKSHEAKRSIRTASAAQVRQPMRRNTAISARYGELLAPLRSLLADTE